MTRPYTKQPNQSDITKRNDKFGEKNLIETSMIGKAGSVRGNYT